MTAIQDIGRTKSITKQVMLTCCLCQRWAFYGNHRIWPAAALLQRTVSVSRKNTRSYGAPQEKNSSQGQKRELKVERSFPEESHLRPSVCELLKEDTISEGHPL